MRPPTDPSRRWSVEGVRRVRRRGDDALGLDVTCAEVDQVSKQRVVVLRRQLVPADLLELAVDLDLDDVCGRQLDAAH